jgi:hypothetical protein
MNAEQEKLRTLLDEYKAKYAPTEEEERLRRFVEILERGGTLVAHPDTLATALKALRPYVLIASERCAPNRWLKPGEIYACEPPQPIKFGFVDIEWPRFYGRRSPTFGFSGE